jgi:uncharacterized membrane protein SirB2
MADRRSDTPARWGDERPFEDDMDVTKHDTLFQSFMRIASNIAGVFLLVAGCVWFLQGINVLPGSFMTGQTKWAVYGALSLIAGIGLLISANRRRT